MRPPKYQKFPLFGKESTRRGDSLDQFRNFLGAFIRLTILHQYFKFHVIRITGYGVIAAKPRVGKLGQIFPCTLQEELCVGSKINDNFYDGHIELYHHAKFGEDRTTRAPAVGAKMWGVFCWSRSESVTYLLTVRSRGAYFEQASRCCLLSDFDEVFSVFSQVILLSDALTVPTFIGRWRHNFRKIAVKNCEKSKNWRKSLCARLHINN